MPLRQVALWHLYLTVFISGMTTLAIELTASRLLGNVFGTSNLVWANVIGLMLLYLTVGYFIGGRLADRYPYPRVMYRMVIWGAFLSALIPLVSRPVLQAAAGAVVGAEAALALGSFISVLVLFSVPITLLGTVSPFAIRLGIRDASQAGRISGQVYAISTVGSIIGTFLPVLIFIPEWGTMQTFLLFSGILYAVGLWGSVRENGWRALTNLWMVVLVAVLALSVMSSPLRAPQRGATLLYEGDSAYNYIQVQEDALGYRYLYLNEGQGIHSQWHPEAVYYRRTWDFFLVAPYFNLNFTPEDMESLLVIGLATGTIPRQHIAVYGDVRIVGVEIDPNIIAVGAEYFEMNETFMPSLEVHAQDGRYVLNQLDEQFTVVAIDAYRPPYIPWHMTTVEFFEEVREHLTQTGVAVINVGRTPDDRRLVEALTNTMLMVFPSVHTIDVPSSFNTILVATNVLTDAQNLRRNPTLVASETPFYLRQILNDGVDNLVPTRYNNILFTDNRAPVETLVDSLVLNFLLSGGVDSLRD